MIAATPAPRPLGCGASEALQDVRGERLHPEREAVHPSGCVGSEQLGGDVLGIALDGHLGPVASIDLPEHPGELVRFEPRGRAAPEEDGGSLPEPHGVGTFELFQATVDIGRGKMVDARPGGKGAIVAAARAERHMHVYAEPWSHVGPLTHEGRRAPPGALRGSQGSGRAWRPLPAGPRNGWSRPRR